MLNVSRTRVPESWLSNVATRPSVGYNTLDREAFVTLEKSRFSVSTIDTELFPELLSWSALTNALPPYCPQIIPSDISKSGDTDTFHDSYTIHEINAIHEADAIHEANAVHEADTVYEVDIEANSVFLSVLDPTTLAVGFDFSCFDGLDENLIHDPLEAFAEACWLDAVGASSSTVRASTPTQLLNKPVGRRKPVPVTIPIPEEREYHYEERAPTSPVGTGVISSASSPRPEQNSFRSKRNTGFSTLSDDDEVTSFILFEAPLLTPNRYDSVGRFPMPSSRLSSRT